MTAVTTLSAGIAAGAIDVALAGGVEHMGRHPMGEGIDPNPRFVAERLVDPDALVMGKTAENLHDRFPHLTRERADAFAAASQQKVAEAYAADDIQPDLVPVAVWAEGGGWDLSSTTNRRGQAPRPRARRAADAVPPARPRHRGQCRWAQRRCDGCVGDSAATADELGLAPKMRLVGYAFAGVDPALMGVGPIPSTERAAAPGSPSTTSG